jgi:WD40 repeat protein
VIFQAGSFKERRDWLLVLRTALDHQRSLSYGTIASAIVPHPSCVGSIPMLQSAVACLAAAGKEVWMADQGSLHLRVVDGETRLPAAETYISWSLISVATTLQSPELLGSHPQQISAMYYHEPSRSMVLAAGNRIALFDVPTYRQRIWWIAHRHAITSVIVTETNTSSTSKQTLFWCAGADGSVYLWDLQAILHNAKRVADTIESAFVCSNAQPSEPISPIAPETILNQDGGHAITQIMSIDDTSVWGGDAQGVMRIWNASTLCLYRELVVRHQSEVTALLRQSSVKIWSAAKDNALWMWHFYLTN